MATGTGFLVNLPELLNEGIGGWTGAVFSKEKHDHEYWRECPYRILKTGRREEGQSST